LSAPSEFFVWICGKAKQPSLPSGQRNNPPAANARTAVSVPQLKSYPDNVIKKAAQDVNMLNGYRTPNAAKKLKTALHGPDHRSLRLPAPSRSRRLIRRVLRLSRTPDASCHLTAKSSFPLPHFVCGSVFFFSISFGNAAKRNSFSKVVSFLNILLGQKIIKITIVFEIEQT